MSTRKHYGRLGMPYDTEDNWNKSEKILLKGELAYVSDTDKYGKYKIGDGVHKFRELEYTMGPTGPQGPMGLPGLPGPTGPQGEIPEEINEKLSTLTDDVASINSNLDRLEYGEIAGGKNLFDIDKLYQNEPGFEYATYKKTGNGFIVTSITSKNKSQILYDFKKEIFGLKEGEIYTLSLDMDVSGISTPTTSLPSVFLYGISSGDAKGALIREGVSGRYSSSFTVQSDEKYRLLIRVGQEWLNTTTGDTLKISNIQIEKGATSSPYKQYTPSVKMLAEKTTQIDDLNVLGWVVPEEMPIKNYVDSDGVFHQRVGRVDLGSLKWTYNSDDYAKAWVSNGLKNIGGVFKYNNVTWYSTSWNAHVWTGRSDGDIVFDKDKYVYCVTSDTTNKPSGYIYYELETPIIMTIDGNEVTERINDSLSVIGKCKNLLKPTLQTTEKNGVTCTDNGDGTYTLNGTASGMTVFYVASNVYLNKPIKLRLVGCPSDGSLTTYSLTLYSHSYSKWYDEYGNGINTNDDISKYDLYIQVQSGYTCNNLVFKPMLTMNLFATYDDFVPYTGDGDTLMVDVASINNNLSGLSNTVEEKIESEVATDFSQADTPEFQQTIDNIADSVSGLRNDIDNITETVGIAIDTSIFYYGIVDSNGYTTIDTDTTLHNIFSDIVCINGTIITPKQNDTIFKVVYYDDNDTFLSVTPWMGLSSFTIVDSYTVNGDNCRLCFANASSDVSTNTIDGHLSKYEFNKNQEKLVNGNKIKYHNDEIEKSVSLPFDGFRLDAKLYKQNGKYYSKINPRDNFIKKDNGVVAYMSPNGSHDADGLTMLTPVKTLAEALSVENVNTIICLSGTYVSGTHYSSAQQVTKEINLIGLGDVVFDNGTNPCIRFYRSVYCENMHFKGGDTAVACELATTERTATFYKCIFSDSNLNNGLSILGGNSYVIDCIAYGNAFDGFNYHAKESIVNHAIEVNCVSYGNGTYHLSESDGQSSNATTSHDGSNIVRVNGDYQCCHGGVVADKECKSANYGCSSGISTVTDENYPDRMSNYWSSNAEMYLFDCDSYGSKYDTAVINDGAIISNVDYPSNYGV